MLVVENLVPANKRIAYSGLLDYEYVMIHETDNNSKGATAEAHARLQARGNDRQASWHETVDRLGAWISYPDNIRCIHAGMRTWSEKSYAIEICVNYDPSLGEVGKRAWFRAAVENAAERAATKLHKKGYGVDRLRMHKDASGKNCPRHLISGDWGVSWKQFKELVQRNLDALNGGVLPAPPDSTDNHGSVSPTPPVSSKTFPEIPLLVDGDFRKLTITALQKVLPRKYNGGTELLYDGVFGIITIKAVQRWLTDLGMSVGPIDGVFGARTIKALQTYLNSQRTYLL